MPDKFRIVGEDRPPPWRWVVWGVVFIVILLALAAGGWWLYHYARGTAHDRIVDADRHSRVMTASRRDLRQQLQREQARATKLATQLAYFQRSQQINGDACKLVKQSLGALQAKNSKLKKQLAFYRGIVSPQQSASGLRVYTFVAQQRAYAPRDYDFEVVLVQALHQLHAVRGRVQIQFEGLQGAKPADYDLSALAGKSQQNLTFSFKYFQDLQGHFKLPLHFRPKRVKVTLQRGGRGDDITQTYKWSDVASSTSEE